MDKSKLTADRVINTRGEHTIEGVGTIKFRALSRMEMLESSQRFEDKPLEQERFILSRAMLDPVLTEDDVAAWQAGSVPGEINEVATKINELSGIGKGAGKSGVS